MPTVLVILFWLWFAGSVVAYFMVKARKKAEAAAEPDPLALLETARTPVPDTVRVPPTPPVAAPAPAEAEVLPAVAKAMADAGLDVPGQPVADTEVADATGVPPDDLAGLEPAVAAVIREERAASGLAPASDATRPAILVGTRAPLVETLHGIAMPLDLAPLSNLAEVPIADANRDRLVMCTSSHDVGEVATALRAELERIGLEVTMLNERTVIAQRGDRAVEVRLHDNPSVERTDSGRTYPTTLAGDVVVEFLAS